MWHAYFYHAKPQRHKEEDFPYLLPFAASRLCVEIFTP
jgi:hypothetical protein